MNDVSGDKPWDARLAFRLVYPFRNTGITPNHLTTLRLVTGIAACVALSTGNYFMANLGAIFFCISNFLDHTDGELARLTGKSSKWGHYYDLASDAAVNILLFIGIGIGLSKANSGIHALPMGCIAGLAVAGIFHVRNRMEQITGKDKARQPNMGIIEAEDVLYLLPLVTVLNLLMPFLILSAIGAPLFLIWVLREFFGLKGRY